MISYGDAAVVKAAAGVTGRPAWPFLAVQPRLPRYDNSPGSPSFLASKLVNNRHVTVALAQYSCAKAGASASHAPSGATDAGSGAFSCQVSVSFQIRIFQPRGVRSIVLV